MRTTLNIPEDLLAEARKASGARTKTATIILGLKEILRRNKLERLWSLRGRLALAVDIEASRKR